MFLDSAETPGAVKVHKDFEVYIPENIRTNIIKESRSLALLVKHFVQNVFTKEALIRSTAQGFPNRVRGSDRLKQEDVLPKLDPDGRQAILQTATAVQEEKKHWRPRVLPSTISQYFSQAVGDEKEDSSSPSSSDTSPSSSSDSSSSSSSDDSDN